MSGGTNFIPTFSYADPGDTDTYGEDCTAAMTARGTTITSVGAPTITRTDGVTMGAGDLSVTAGPTVINSGLAYVFTASGGMAGVTYNLRFALTLAATPNVIYRTVRIPVLATVG